MKKYIFVLAVFSLFITLLGFHNSASAQVVSSGCMVGDVFSRTTGQPCGYSVDCMPGDVFSSVTGQACGSTSTPIPVYPPGCTSYSSLSSITGLPCDGSGSTTTPIPTNPSVQLTYTQSSSTQIGNPNLYNFSLSSVNTFDKVVISSDCKNNEVKISSTLFGLLSCKPFTVRLMPTTGISHSLYLNSKDSNVHYVNLKADIYYRGAFIGTGSTVVTVYPLTRNIPTQPSITSLSSTSAPIGSSVTIYGSGFDKLSFIALGGLNKQGVPFVTINPSSGSSTSLTFIVPSIGTDPANRSSLVPGRTYTIQVGEAIKGANFSNSVNFTISPQTINCSTLQQGQQSYFNLCNNEGYENVCFDRNGAYQGCTNNANNDCTVSNTNASTNTLCSVGATQATISTATDNNGTISPSGHIVVPFGTNQTFVFTPNAGYQVSNIGIDNKFSAPTASSYTFYNITGSHIIGVSFNKIPITVTQPSITVLSPNGGEVIKQGSTQTIKWNSQGISSVYIKLRKGSDTYYGDEGAVTMNVNASQGYYNWNVPTTLPNGNDYAIRVIDLNGAQVLDDSDSYFTITAPTTVALPTITSISPTSGPIGALVTINGSGFTSPSYVLIDGRVASTVSISPSNSNSMTFTVPSATFPQCNLFTSGDACAQNVMIVSPGGHNVSVITANGTSNALNFTITANATATYSCPSGAKLDSSGNTCTTTSTASATASYSCPSGYQNINTSNNTCTAYPPRIPGRLGSPCGLPGYTFSQNGPMGICTRNIVDEPATAPAVASYSCPTGSTLDSSGSNCATTSTAPATSSVSMISAGSLMANVIGATTSIPKTTIENTVGAGKFNFTQFLSRGSYGNEVTELQKVLSTAGYYSGNVDGKFGATTEAALIQFQTTNKLKADGIFGYEVRTFLNK